MRDGFTERNGQIREAMLLAGGVAFAIASGVHGGLWCASRRRTRSARALEWIAPVLYCGPVHAVEFGLLLLVAPTFGLVELPQFFDPDSYAAPLENPWDFVRMMIPPWIVVGAPTGAAILRLTLPLAIDTLGDDHLRTAAAEGGPARDGVRRHAGPPTSVSVASLLGTSAPFMVTNMVLVVRVHDPRLFRHTKRALSQAPGWGLATPAADHRHRDATGARLWAAVLIVALGLSPTSRHAARPTHRAGTGSAELAFARSSSSAAGSSRCQKPRNASSGLRRRRRSTAT